jgi:hypothetical protein
LLALTCLALAKYNTILGIFGLFTVVIGLYAFSYMDKQEQSVRERELREEILSTEREQVSEERLTSASDELALVFMQVDDYDEVFHGLADEKRPMLVAAVDKLLREWRILRVEFIPEGVFRKTWFWSCGILGFLESLGPWAGRCSFSGAL